MASAAATRPGIRHALPFWSSLLLVPLSLGSVAAGGLWLLAVPVCSFVLFGVLDRALGIDRVDLDPATPDADLVWHRAILLIWPPVQGLYLVVMLAWVPGAVHLSGPEQVGAFLGAGILTGAIGIPYAHELMHSARRGDRWRADILLAMALYGHFRSEHLLVHHIHVATPRDMVSARDGEGFWRFFRRVLPGCLRSAWTAERAMLSRRGLPWWDRTNPFWRYYGLQALALLAALSLGGWVGLALFVVQAAVAVFLLEVVNYVEHYGLTRAIGPNGRYEPARAHHSWNASPWASNRLLINLQRHSDHHAKPARPFPLLRSNLTSEAPQLPFGYPVMTVIALVPPLWRRMMGPRLRDWRARHYPDPAD